MTKSANLGSLINKVRYASTASGGIQAAIDQLTPGLAAGGIVSLAPGKSYTIAAGEEITIPANVTLDCRGATITYTGSGTAITLGTSDSVLDYFPKVLNMVLVLTNIAAWGVRLRGTSSAHVTGYIEGPTNNYATRTNRGVVIDGVDCSAFFNRIEVDCNHIHQSYTVTTTGTTQPTQQYFANCTALGDWSQGDTTAIGFYFDSSSAQTGQGTVIQGCNVEDVSICYYAGANAGHATVLGGRVEITVDAANWKFDFVNGCDSWTIIGLQGLGSTYMESNSGIRNFDSNEHVLLGTDDGTLRLGGFDKALNAGNFLGIGGATPQIWVDANADFNVLIDSDNTGTGRIVMQAGQGSSDQGAGVILHSHAHATNPGDLDLYPSANSGDVVVRNGIGGSVVARIEKTSTVAADETNLWLYNGRTGSVTQVKAGTSGTGPGGSGYALYMD